MDAKTNAALRAWIAHTKVCEGCGHFWNKCGGNRRLCFAGGVLLSQVPMEEQRDVWAWWATQEQFV